MKPQPALRIAPVPRAPRKNPEGGVRRAPGPVFPAPHPFETFGEFRLWTNGKAGPWQRGPADRGIA